MASIGELVGKIKLDTKGVTSSLQDSASAVEEHKQAFQGLALAGTATVAAMAASVNKFGREAARQEDVQAGFARNFGENMSSNLATLQEAAGGTIDDYDLMLNANRAALLGVADNTTQLAGLLETARLRAREMGLTTTQAFNDIVTGIGRGSPLILDNLGIVIPEAVKEMGQSMDEAGRKQLLLNTVLQDGAKIAADYGGVTVSSAEKVQAMEAQFRNATSTLGEGLLPILLSVTSVTTGVIKSVGEFTKNNKQLVTSVGKVVLVVGSVVTTFATAALAVTKAVAAVKALTVAFTALKAGSMFLLGPIGLLAAGVGVLTAAFIHNAHASSQSSSSMSNTGKEAKRAAGSMDSFGKSAVKAGGSAAGAMSDVADRIKGIRQQIDEEKRAYNRQLADIVRQRQQSIRDNKAALEQERKEFERQQADIESSYKESTKSIKEEQSARLKALEISMQKSLQVGSDTYEEDLANFQEAIENEKQVEQEKLEEAKTLYEQQTTQLEDEFRERTSKLEEQLAEDRALLEKHSEAISQIKKQEAKDEIEVLKAAHEQRLQELNKQLQKERVAYGSHTNQVGDMYKQMAEETREIERQIAGSMGKVLLKTPEALQATMDRYKQGRTTRDLFKGSTSVDNSRAITQNNNIYTIADYSDMNTQLNRATR